MISWEEYDALVKDEISTSYVQADMLRAQLAVLIVKRMVTCQTPVDEIQLALAIRYGVEYNPSDVSDEITCILHEAREEDTHVLEPEDHFEGF